MSNLDGIWLFVIMIAVFLILLMIVGWAWYWSILVAWMATGAAAGMMGIK